MSIYREFYAFPGPVDSLSREDFFTRIREQLDARRDSRWELELKIGEKEHRNERRHTIHLAYLDWRLPPKPKSDFTHIHATVGSNIWHGRGSRYYLIIPNSLYVYGGDKYEPGSDWEAQALVMNEAVLSACMALFETSNADILTDDVDTWDGYMNAKEAMTHLPGDFSLLRTGLVPHLEQHLSRLNSACDPRGSSYAIGDDFIQLRSGPMPVGMPSYRMKKWGTGIAYDYDEELIEKCHSFSKKFRKLMNKLLPGWDANVPQFTVDGKPVG